ncbi:MAG TPA: glycosyltransferase family 39 protein [Solirubrobacteraceae bacterium]|nr:glycosyltransferase family 39 protein [Solirubrobacteraceae bacterium]
MSRPGIRAVVVAAILIIALVLRVAEVDRTSFRPINDAGSYLALASQIAHTGDYSLSHRPGSGAGGSRGPSAYFAPGYPYFLALVDLLDGHAVRRGAAIQPARLSQAVLGTIAVALIGLVALELFGEEAGLIALVIAAVYPVLIELSGVLVAENLLVALILATVYAGLRVRRARSTKARLAWVASAGVLTGLATLTHENAVVIIVPLIAAVWTERPRLELRSLAAPTLLLAAAVLVIVPWTLRNELVMHRFIPVSDETGITLVGTYNAASAANPVVPYKWRIFSVIPGERALIDEAGRLTEPEIGSKLQRQALHYISKHPLSPFAVGYHNGLRLLELEGSFAWRASAAAISLPLSVARSGVLGFWVLSLLALAGAFTRLARRAPRWVWVVPLLLALSVVLVNAETPRFREPIDPFLILLAAAGLATLVGRLRGAPVVGEARSAVPARPAQLVEMVERLA